MPMVENPYTQNGSPYPTPDWGQAGVNLGTALFGNPQAAAQQQLMRAQAANAQADAAQRQGDAARFATEADAARAKLAAEGSLPGLFTGAYGTAPATAPSYSAPDATGIMAITPGQAGGQRMVDPVGLAHLLAGLAQVGVADPKGYVGALGAYAGGDSDARRALVAQGASPSADFAIDIPRAQDIAATKEAADTARQVAVADTTGNWNLKGKKVEAGATVQAAGIHAGAEEYGANTAAAASRANNTADNAQKMWDFNQRGAGRGPANFAPSQLGNMDGEIGAQFPNLPADLKTAVRVRAIDIARVTGNPAGAVQQAGRELVQTNQGLFGTSYSPRPAASGSPRVIRYDNKGNRIQ